MMNRVYRIWLMLLSGGVGMLYGSQGPVRGPGTYAYILKIDTSTRAFGGRAAPLPRNDHFYLVYQGQLLLLHGNVAVIKKQRCSFVFSLVITADIEYGSCAGGCMMLKKHEPVRWFDITCLWNGISWQYTIDELASSQISSILPDHAIVFLYDPSLVSGLRMPVCTCYCQNFLHEGGCCMFELPSVELQGSPAAHAAAHLRVQAALPEIRTCNRPVNAMVQLGDARYSSLHLHDR